MNARRRVQRIQEILSQIGLEAERVRMFNMSAAMSGQFVQAAEEMDQKVKDLGPNPLRLADSRSQLPENTEVDS